MEKIAFRLPQNAITYWAYCYFTLSCHIILVEMGASNSEADREHRLNQTYLAIISRYKDYIEEKEGLSVAELPMLVTPENPKVKQKAEAVKNDFLNYTYESNFEEAAARCYEFVKREVDDVVLPLQFWLTPEETLEFMMGDAMDKNILLCSMLICLGNPSSRVFVKMGDNSRKVFVHYEFKGRVCLMDLDNAAKRFEGKQQLLNAMEIKDETIAYEFNNQMYADIY